MTEIEKLEKQITEIEKNQLGGALDCPLLVARVKQYNYLVEERNKLKNICQKN
tara:strand:+ start:3405 stop:3563 length:159 start_codon:yes stop_codon:yes gene_type:complete